MKTQIVTTAEIKKILGITGTTDDATIELGNDSMTEVLLDLLGLDNFDVTAYIDEEIEVYNREYLELNNYPIEISSPVPTLKDLNFTALTSYPDSWFLEDSQKPFLKGKNSAGNLFVFDHKNLLVSYSAGWRVASVLTVVAYGSMTGKTFTVKGAGTTTTYTEGVDFDAETSNAVTAGNIATAIGGTLSDETIILPAGYSYTYGTMTDTEATIEQFNLPSAFRTAVALLVGGFMASKEKKGGVTSYSLGSKSVSFKDSEDSIIFKSILRAYLPNNLKFNCA